MSEKVNGYVFESYAPFGDVIEVDANDFSELVNCLNLERSH